MHRFCIPVTLHRPRPAVPGRLMRTQINMPDVHELVPYSMLLVLVLRHILDFTPIVPFAAVKCNNLHAIHVQWQRYRTKALHFVTNNYFYKNITYPRGKATPSRFRAAPFDERDDLNEKKIRHRAGRFLWRHDRDHRHIYVRRIQEVPLSVRIVVKEVNMFCGII